ncbi:active breakpoint cluster region-related protein isoform X1 [Pygocentrus nattereri]|uniref:active breakpoint cluster region-related protein isoform X1 n=1 Tax=Pygocentrus nattereri TaxID=42514 RepID=UPI0008146CF3|nr:active breakpoint cluster region-related protein isoform X1 [Pygocentrus nattereri]
MELYSEALQYLASHGLPAMEEEEEAVDSDLLQDVFSDDTGWVPNSTEVPGLPDTPTYRSPEDLLEKRLLLLREILISEEVYLSELETLLTPMKALRASAGTSQPVLSIEQVQIVFYQLPELRDLHKEFHSGLRARLQSVDMEPGIPVQLQQRDLQLSVGDLFLKFVSQLGLYRGFIDNYESAVQIVRKSTQSNPRFRVLAESMMYSKGSDGFRTKYTFEALLYKPLDRVTKTTLVLHDLLKHTPCDHHDSNLLQEALRVSSSFLSGVNEGSQQKRAVTLSRGERRQLVRDGFVVDVCEGGRSLRHLFLYTDLLLCVKLKGGTMGRQLHYRFCWYMPLAGLKMHWAAEQDPSADLQLKISNMRAKMFHCRRMLQEYMRESKGSVSRAADRCRRKLEACELWLLTHTPSFILELHSPNSKSHIIHLSSLHELDEWREAISKHKTEDLETVLPDLLSLANSCVKLRMTQQLPLCCLQPEKVNSMCGSLSVVVHTACGLQQPASVYVCVEVDGFEIFDRRAQTCLSSYSLTPQWDQELVLQVDGAQHLRLLCLSQSQEDIMGRATLQLDSLDMLKKWKKMTLNLGLIEVIISIKYTPHPLEPPSFTPLQQKTVFSVLIGDVARQEGVLVPHIVRSCVEEIERRGLEEEGIYRISGASREIQALKHAFDTNYWEAVSKVRSVDVNTVSGTLKLYFRELPEPLIPTDHFQSLSKALADLADPYHRAEMMLSELQSFPDVNRNTLLFLLHHLKRVAQKAEQNKMSLSNLATVFGPSLLRSPVASLNHCGPPVDISQEVEVQVQVIYLYLQNQNLPEAVTTKLLETEEEP